jgi:hypothetical protein
MAKKSTSPKAPQQTSMDQLFAKASQVATKAKPKSTKKEAPIVYIDEGDVELMEVVRKMIPLLVINKKVGTALKSHESEGKDRLFRQWVDQVWAQRVIPENSRMAIRKENGLVIDMSVIFQVKHKADGITVPDELPPGKTAIDHILLELTSPVVGLSCKNATKLVKDGVTGEVLITNEYYIPDIVQLTKSDDARVRRAAEKLMRYISGEFTDLFTPEEQAKVLLQRQRIRLKDGFIGRSFEYCDNSTQLYNLLNYVKIGLALSNPEFAEADTLVERTLRMHQTVDELVFGTDEESNDE